MSKRMNEVGRREGQLFLTLKFQLDRKEQLESWLSGRALPRIHPHPHPREWLGQGNQIGTALI